MGAPQELVERLRRAISAEIVAALGLSPTGGLSRLLEPVFYLPAQRFARLAASVDQAVSRVGLQAALRGLLPRFVRAVDVSGAGDIPTSGPLLVASNHPGAYDILALLSSLPRGDVKILVSGAPFLRSLPAISQHLIFLSANAHQRMAAVRQSLRHLHQQGCLLYFPSGKVDPDPAVLPGAQDDLTLWSSSLELFLRRLPEARLLVAMVSGVLSPRFFHHPLTRLRRIAWERRKLAEFLQVIVQMLSQRPLDLAPYVTYGQPRTAAELLADGRSLDLGLAILAEASRVLAYHQAGKTSGLSLAG